MENTQQNDNKLEDLCDKVNKISIIQEEQSAVVTTTSEDKETNGNPDESEESKEDGKSATSAGDSGKSSEHDETSDDENSEESDSKELLVPIEGENIIVEYRAKLFRFENETKQWKERGLGQIRLLQSLHNFSKCRVTMWRDGNGLLACNFSLFPELQVLNFQNSPKVLCWKCYDSCAEAEWETFTCRFQSEAECTDFKNKMMEYATNPPALPEALSALMNNTGNENDLAETYHSEDEENPHIGCRGCSSSGFEFTKEVSPKTKEPLITCALNSDSCNETPKAVSISTTNT